MIENIVDRIATRRGLWVFGCATACLFLFFNVSPFGVPRFRQYTHIPGPGAGMLDLQFACSPERIYRLLAEYGDGGRHYYFFLLAVDFVFPVVYGLFLAAVLRVFARRAFSSDSRWMNLYVIPLL